MLKHSSQEQTAQRCTCKKKELAARDSAKTRAALARMNQQHKAQQVEFVRASNEMRGALSSKHEELDSANSRYETF